MINTKNIFGKMQFSQAKKGDYAFNYYKTNAELSII